MAAATEFKNCAMRTKIVQLGNQECPDMPREAHTKAAEHHENAAKSLGQRPNTTAKVTTRRPRGINQSPWPFQER